MLQPRKTKYRKRQKGRIKGLAQRGAEVSFGTFGIKALQPAFISAKQIEAARVAITRHLRRAGKVWIRIFPDYPVTRKPLEVRMGKGKGNPEFWAARVKPGTVLFEVDGVSEEAARRALWLGAQKLPVKTKLVFRRDYLQKQ